VSPHTPLPRGGSGDGPPRGQRACHTPPAKPLPSGLRRRIQDRPTKPHKVVVTRSRSLASLSRPFFTPRNCRLTSGRFPQAQGGYRLIDNQKTNSKNPFSNRLLEPTFCGMDSAGNPQANTAAGNGADFEAPVEPLLRPRPPGRPRGSRNRRTLLGNEFLRTLGPKAKKRLSRIIEGDDDELALRAALVVLHYTYGKPIEAREISGPDGEPVSFDTGAGEVDLARRVALLLERAGETAGSSARGAAVGASATGAGSFTESMQAALRRAQAHAGAGPANHHHQHRQRPPGARTGRRRGRSWRWCAGRATSASAGPSCEVRRRQAPSRERRPGASGSARHTRGARRRRSSTDAAWRLGIHAGVVRQEAGRGQPGLDDRDTGSPARTTTSRRDR